MTAHVGIGHEDLYRGGLGPTHTMWLWESGRPAWILEPMLAPEERSLGAEKSVRLIPGGPEHILADGLLLVALRASVSDVALLAETLDLFPLVEDEFIDLTKHDPALIAGLREELPRLGLREKLAISVFGGSSLESQLPVLEQYPVDVEVCTVTYSRLSGGWRTGVEERGSLRASWGPHGPNPDRYREVNFPTDLPAALEDETSDEPK